MHYAEGSAMLPLLLLLYSSSLGENAAPLMDRIFSEIHLHIGYLSKCLGDNEFFFRNKFSGLDTMLSFVLEAAKISDSLKDYSNLIDALDRYQSRPAYKKALEKGGEYILLDDILKKEIVFTGIVIEFHEVSKHVEEIENFITILNLKLVHLHINNYASITPGGIPEVIELSFSRNGDSNYFQNKLPHKLDQNNDPDSWSYELSFEIE